MDTHTPAPAFVAAPVAAADDTVALGPEMTIAQAATCRDTLVDALCASAGDLTLDLSAVTDIDSAGVQLLLATRRSVAERGAVLTLSGAQGAVADALAVFGLDHGLEALDSAGAHA